MNSKLLIAWLLLLSYNSYPAIRYVSKTGSSTPPYLTWETAADSIQKCINICSAGDTIYVGAGIYKEKIIMIDSLSLIGAGWGSCIIDTRAFATTDFYAVIMKNHCLIEGFHIMVKDNQTGTGISTIRGSGDSLFYQGEIRYNKFSLAEWAISTMNDILIIRDNFFDNCDEAIDIFSIYTSAVCSVHDNYLVNIIHDGITTNLGGSAIIYNNIIRMNGSINQTSPRGIGLYSQGQSNIYNNLVINANTGSGIGITTNGLPAEVFNNYITGNFAVGIQIHSNDIARNNVITGCYYGFHPWEGLDFICSYNNAWNNEINFNNFTPDSTNISVDPMVVNEDSLDFHLQKYSPLIDAGDPNILDLDGTRSDIGLYGGPFGEITDYKDYAPKAPKGLTITADSAMIYLSWKKNTEADFRYYLLYRDTTAGFSADSSTLLQEVNDTFFVQQKPVGINRLYFKLKAIDNQKNLSQPSDEVGVVLSGIYGNGDLIVQEYGLYQNYPNPFNPVTKIPFRLKERGFVMLTVYNINGELVSTLVNGEKEAGYHEVEFRAKGTQDQNLRIASGVYIYQIDVKNDNQIPRYRQTRKMIFLK